MTAKATAWISLAMVAGIVIGGWLGTMFPTVMTALGFIGDTFLGGLTVLSLVVVVSTLVTSVSTLGDTHKFRFAFFKNLGFWGITLLAAMGIALGLGQFVLTDGSGGAAALNGSRSLPGINLGSAVFWLGTILAAIGMGLATIRLKIKARSLTTWFKNLSEGGDDLTKLMTSVLPVGMMFVVANYVARDGYPVASLSWLAGNFVLTVVIGLAALGLVVMPLILGLMSGANPFGLFGKLLPAILTAFGSMSSRLALPFVISALENDRQCDKRATGLAVSLGTVFNVAPTVLVVMVATMFMANVTGTTLPLYQLLLIGVTAAALSIGIGSGAGMVIPVMVGAISLTGDLSSLSPALVLIVSVTWLLEPVRAAFTTLGDAGSAAVLSQAFEFKTALRSPARTAPRRFGFDRSDRPDGREQRTDRSSSRGRTDSRTERSPRGRRPSSRDTDRRPAGDKDRGRGRDRKDSRDTRSSFSRSTSHADHSVKEYKESVVKDTSSPFSIKSGGDPVLEMTGSQAPAVSSKETGTGRARSRSRTGETKRTERKPASTESGRRRSAPRGLRESDRTESGNRSQPDTGPPTEDTNRKSRPGYKEPSGDSRTGATREGKDSLATSKIKDELARVSEQLKSMDDRIKPIASDPAPASDTIETKSPVTDSPPIDVKPATNERPVAEELPAPKVESPVEKPEPAVKSEPVETSAGISDEEKRLAASFGRSKERTKDSGDQSSDSKNEALDRVVDSTPEPVEAEAKPASAGSAKAIEFGRSKRKKRMR